MATHLPWRYSTGSEYLVLTPPGLLTVGESSVHTQHAMRATVVLTILT